MNILYGPNFKVNSPTVVAIGKFDGLHIGHLRVIEILRDIAENANLSSVVYTFRVNPKIVLKHDQFIPLMTNKEKSEELALLGVDYVIYEEFDRKFANMLPEEFVKNILIDKLNMKVVVMGENSTFGKDKAGNVEIMKFLGYKYGFKVCVVELMKKDGEIISSSRIRESVR